MKTAESVTKAAQCAALLEGDVREAMLDSCLENPILQILLHDLLVDVRRIADRLRQIDGLMPESKA